MLRAFFQPIPEPSSFLNTNLANGYLIDHIPRLLLVPSFRTIKLRKAQVNCRGCSPAAQLEFRNNLNQCISSTHQPKTCGKSALPEGTVRCFERISADVSKLLSF